ncbi:Hypothetical predicted protein [Cloeon dipterum]|uniref:Uncharacterized protein n=1 Tax=Cloeon dipterum TaxID=197152 RepID=A0A8S1D7D2_9INSE|nr:Hypothetical predicted protein [Cloeon dipterum]
MSFHFQRANSRSLIVSHHYSNEYVEAFSQPMSRKSVLIAGTKDVDKRIFAITIAEFLASQNYAVIIITKSFNFLPQPLHGTARDSENYRNISLRYPQNLSELAEIIFDFSFFLKLSKGPFTVIAENIEDFGAPIENIAKLVAALGATPNIPSQEYPKLVAILNCDPQSFPLENLYSLFNSIWITEKTEKEVCLSLQGRGKVCFEEMQLNSNCPNLVLRVKSILLH